MAWGNSTLPDSTLGIIVNIVFTITADIIQTETAAEFIH